MGAGYTHLAASGAAALCLAHGVTKPTKKKRAGARTEAEGARCWESRDDLSGLGWARAMRAPVIVSREAVLRAERGLGALAAAPEVRSHVLQMALQIEEIWGSPENGKDVVSGLLLALARQLNRG